MKKGTVRQKTRLVLKNSEENSKFIVQGYDADGNFKSEELVVPKDGSSVVTKFSYVKICEEMSICNSCKFKGRKHCQLGQSYEPNSCLSYTYVCSCGNTEFGEDDTHCRCGKSLLAEG